MTISDRPGVPLPVAAANRAGGQALPDAGVLQARRPAGGATLNPSAAYGRTVC
jgi:hypothetical protein